MDTKNRLKWMLADAESELTKNPFMKLYYYFRMKGYEIWEKIKHL